MYSNDSKSSAISYTNDSEPVAEGTVYAGYSIGLLLTLTYSAFADGFINDSEPSAVSFTFDIKPS